MRIVPFTVNSPDRMRELIRMGVDGIITDRPSTLRKVCEELGIVLPPPDLDFTRFARQISTSKLQ